MRQIVASAAPRMVEEQVWQRLQGTGGTRRVRQDADDPRRASFL